RVASNRTLQFRRRIVSQVKYRAQTCPTPSDPKSRREANQKRRDSSEQDMPSAERSDTHNKGAEKNAEGPWWRERFTADSGSPAANCKGKWPANRYRVR